MIRRIRIESASSSTQIARNFRRYAEIKEDFKRYISVNRTIQPALNAKQINNDNHIHIGVSLLFWTRSFCYFVIFAKHKYVMQRFSDSNYQFSLSIVCFSVSMIVSVACCCCYCADLVSFFFSLSLAF